MENTSRPDATPSIRVENLSFQYTQHGKPILDRVDLTLPAGSRTLIVGLNGSGKSSLMRILAGNQPLVRIGAGSELPMAVELGTDKHRPYMDPQPLRHVRLMDNTGFQLASQDLVGRLLVPPSDSKLTSARRRMCMAALHLDPAWRLAQLSDGMRRRAQLTYTLQHQIPLYLLDEADEGLDPVFRARLLRILLEETKQTHKLFSVAPEQMSEDSVPPTVVFTTHYFAGLENWPTHILHMRQAQVVKLVTKAEFDAMASDFAKQQMDTGCFSSDATPFIQLLEHWLDGDYECTESSLGLDQTW